MASPSWCAVSGISGRRWQGRGCRSLRPSKPPARSYAPDDGEGGPVRRVGDDVLAQILPTVASLLALALSLVNLYLQRRDRRPRLRIRTRYEYRVGDSMSQHDREDGALPRIHYDSQ